MGPVPTAVSDLFSGGPKKRAGPRLLLPRNWGRLDVASGHLLDFRFEQAGDLSSSPRDAVETATDQKPGTVTDGGFA